MITIQQMPVPELEAMLDSYPDDPSSELALEFSAIRKGLQAELAERALGMTLAEAMERIRDAEQEEYDFDDYECDSREEKLDEIHDSDSTLCNCHCGGCDCCL